MLPSMPETPLALSWFAYGLFKRLKKDLPASEYLYYQWNPGGYLNGQSIFRQDITVHYKAHYDTPRSSVLAGPWLYIDN